jgi:hypothetical protein
MERALAATSDLSFVERVTAGIGTASSMLALHGNYSKMCSTQSQVSRTWAQACLRYGELAERQSDTIMGESIARSVQVVALKHLDEPARQAEVVARRDEASRVMRDNMNVNVAADELMWSSPGFIADYLNVLAQQGEMAALRWKHTEAARLRAELPPCLTR